MIRSYGEYITNYPGVIRTETEEIINMDTAKFNFGNGELSNSAIIYNADDYRMIGPFNLIEKLNTTSADDIFVPYSFKTSGDYELGDHFTIQYQGKEYKYQIAGFFETTMLATNNIGVMKFMLPETSYGALVDELDNKSKALSVSAVMEDPTQSPELKNDFIQHVQQSTEVQTTPLLFGD